MSRLKEILNTYGSPVEEEEKEEEAVVAAPEVYQPSGRLGELLQTYGSKVQPDPILADIAANEAEPEPNFETPAADPSKSWDEQFLSKLPPEYIDITNQIKEKLPKYYETQHLPADDPRVVQLEEELDALYQQKDAILPPIEAQKYFEMYQAGPQEVTQDEVLQQEITKEEIRERLTGIKVLGGLWELTPEQAATAVGFGKGMQNVFRGGQQIFDDVFDTELSKDFVEEQKYVNQLLQSEEFGTRALIGEVGGMIADPTAWAGGTGLARAGFNVASGISKLRGGVQLSKSSSLALNGMAAGGGWGMLDYIDEEAGETRIGNAATGAVFGLVLGKSAGKYLEWREVRKAQAIQKQMEAPIDAIRHRVADLVTNSDMTLKQAVEQVQKDSPELYKLGLGNLKQLKTHFNFGQAIRDFKAIDAMESGMATVDSVPRTPSRFGREWDKAKRTTRTTFDKLLGLMSTRVSNIDERVGGALKKMEAQNNVDVSIAMQKRENFANFFASISDRKPSKAVLQFSGDEAKLIKSHLLNGNFNDARAIISKRGEDATKAFDDVVDLLDDFKKRQQKLGIIDGEVENYWPRIISRGKMEEYLDTIGKEGKKDFNEMYRARIDEINTSMMTEGDDMYRGFEMSEMEKNMLFQQMFLKEQADFHTYSHAMKRSMGKVKNDIIDYFEDPIEALDSYIHNATAEINKAEFFELLAKGSYKAGLGKDPEDMAGFFNLDAALNAVVKGKYDADDAKELREILKVRFGRANTAPGGIYNFYRNYVNSSLLANFSSAATQLGDLGSSMMRNGVVRSTKGFVKTLLGNQNRIKLEDLNLESMRYTEFEDLKAGKFKKISDGLMTVSGFNKIDRIGKETFVNAALERGQKLANMDSTSHAYRMWEKKYVKAWGRADFEDLKAGLKNFDWDAVRRGEQAPSRNVLTYVFNELSDFQPISKSEMPELYHTNAKFLYALKSFTLKQLDIWRRDVIGQITEGVAKGDVDAAREGAQNLMKYVGYVGGMNLGAEYIKSELLGDPDRNPFSNMTDDAGNIAFLSLLEAGMFSSLKAFGLNDYSLAQIAKGDLQDWAYDMANFATPGFSEVVAGGADMLGGAQAREVWADRHLEIKRYFPLIGKHLHAGYFPGIYDERKSPEKFENEDKFEEVPLGEFKDGGLVDKQAIVEEAKQEKVEQKPEINGTKLDVGVYQDEDGNLFKVDKDGEIQPLNL